MNNPFGEGTVEVSSDDLDFTTPEAAAIQAAPAAAAATAPAAPATADAKAATRPAKPRQAPVRLPSAMVPGAWVEILTDSDSTHTAA